MSNPFQDRRPDIGPETTLRIPQREVYEALEQFRDEAAEDREVGIILPVGCGKSGCITLAPFALKAKRALVVAPSVQIAQQLHDDFDPTNPGMFYRKSKTLVEPPFPEPVEIRGRTTNLGDLKEADVVITNIQQLQGEANRWLQSLPLDFFDLILFDEGHHNVATSWEVLRNKFPAAKIVNLSATPLRADGQLMAGRTLYSYPVARSIQEGYVKRLKAIVLNPRTLRYVRKEDDQEVVVSLDEVRRLGEEDADFRRSIVSSEETLTTIVDASIGELQKLRVSSGESRLKIIASALNYAHCAQIVEAFRERGLKADYVHSLQESKANEKVLRRLNNHELDVIVQVRKLGEGFDHPYLAVAAVLSVFSNLSPFVQFVGRIMRVIDQDDPTSAKNRGVVVFHAGANVARRWADFQEYSEADQEYFDQLLPLEGLDFTSSDEIEVIPVDEAEKGHRSEPSVEIRHQSKVDLTEIPLLKEDQEAIEFLRRLKERGYSTKEVQTVYEELETVPVTKVRKRQARRATLDMKIKTEVGRILGSCGLSYEGRDLDREHRGRSNFLVLKASIDKKVNDLVGHSEGQRSEVTKPELDLIDAHFERLIAEVEDEVTHE